MKFLRASDEASAKASGPIAISSRTFLDSIIKLLQRNFGNVDLVVEGSRLCTNCHFWTPSYLDLTHELHLPLQILTALRWLFTFEVACRKLAGRVGSKNFESGAQTKTIHNFICTASIGEQPTRGPSYACEASIFLNSIPI